VTDPFERGFESAQRRRLDLPPEPTSEERKRWQRPGRLGWQVILIALGVVVLLAVGRAVTARNATGLHANCAKFQLAVAEKSVPSRGATLLHWAVTAPAGTRFVVSLNRPGVSLDRGDQQSSREVTMSSKCLAHGQFGVLVPPGRYELSLLRVGLPGGVVQRQAVHPVTVTAS